MNREKFEEQREAYVLGALPEDERREFEAYLAANPELRSEVDELSSVASLLSLSPEEQPPPPELRERVMDAIGAEPEEPVEITDGQRGLLGRFGGFQRLALGAAAVLLVGLLSWNIILQMEDQERKVYKVLGPGDTNVELIVLEDDRAVLVADKMPPPPEGKTYQIWNIKEGQDPEPSGFIEPTGRRTATGAIEKPLEGVNTVAVTVEPAGGSPSPTGDPVMQIKL